MFQLTDHYLVLDNESYMSKFNYQLINSNKDLDDAVEYLTSVTDSIGKIMFHPLRMKNIKLIASGLKDIGKLPYCMLLNKSQIGVHFVMGNFYASLEPTINPNYTKQEEYIGKEFYKKLKETQDFYLKSMDRLTLIKAYSQGEIFFVNYRYRAKNIKMKYLVENSFADNYKNFNKLLEIKELQEAI